ncbi:hypothetical protein SUGI_0066050 [Cryptomeria japonica]|nr:hypothetical protein SUGI_0066050 [Cryptomeria japonica]
MLAISTTSLARALIRVFLIVFTIRNLYDGAFDLRLDKHGFIFMPQHPLSFISACIDHHEIQQFNLLSGHSFHWITFPLPTCKSRW